MSSGLHTSVIIPSFLSSSTLYPINTHLPVMIYNVFSSLEMWAMVFSIAEKLAFGLPYQTLSNSFSINSNLLGLLMRTYFCYSWNSFFNSLAIHPCQPLFVTLVIHAKTIFHLFFYPTKLITPIWPFISNFRKLWPFMPNLLTSSLTGTFTIFVVTKPVIHPHIPVCSLRSRIFLMPRPLFHSSAGLMLNSWIVRSSLFWRLLYGVSLRRHLSRPHYVINETSHSHITDSFSLHLQWLR